MDDADLVEALEDAVAEALADAVEELVWCPIAPEVRLQYDRRLGLDEAEEVDAEALVRVVRDATRW